MLIKEIIQEKHNQSHIFPQLSCALGCYRGWPLYLFPQHEVVEKALPLVG